MKKKKTTSTSKVESIDDIFSKMNDLNNEDMLVRNGVDAINDGLIYKTSGVYALDWIVSNGRGLPKGKMIEIFGPENCGKTALTSCIFSKWQKDGKVVMLDYEHRYNIEYAISHGVNKDKLIFIQPRSGEKGLELVERRIVKATGVEVVAIDSIPAIVTKQEMKGDYGDANIGAQAKLVTQFVRQLSGRLRRDSPLIILVNQLRDAVGDMFKNEKTPGGRAMKFFVSLRINMRKKTKIKDGNEVIGHNIKISIEKSSIGPAHKEIEVPFYYSTGFDNYPFILSMAKDVGMFKSSAFHLNEKESISESKVENSRKLQYKVWKEILRRINSKEEEPANEEETKVVEYKLNSTGVRGEGEIPQ